MTHVKIDRLDGFSRIDTKDEALSRTCSYRSCRLRLETCRNKRREGNGRAFFIKPFGLDIVRAYDLQKRRSWNERIPLS